MNGMNDRPRQPRRPVAARHSTPSRPPPPGSESWRTPWVQMKYYSFHPCIFPAMIRAASPDAEPGQFVHVYDKDGQPFGQALYNPHARVPLRVLHHGTEPVGEEHFAALLDRALDLRLGLFTLPAITDSFRVVHSDGDGLSGLVVDKFADVLAVEVHSLGIFQRLPGWLPRLHARLGTKRTVVTVDSEVANIERIEPTARLSDDVTSVRIMEHGVRFEVNLKEGHKTGFFCDQRENRRRFAPLVKDARVLDLCCYTGGFAITAALRGGAKETVGVDLDEKAIAQARRNANLNQVSPAHSTWAHCDAFSFARQMQKNGEKFDAVVVDPPKFMASRDTAHEDRWRYEDLNGLAMSVARPGAVIVTCSCSGLLTPEDFEQIIHKAAHRLSRRLQIFDRTGAGPDHPVMSNCPESHYLKVIWGRVW